MIVRAVNAASGQLVEHDLDPETALVAVVLARPVGDGLIVGGSLGREELLVPLAELQRCLTVATPSLTQRLTRQKRRESDPASDSQR